MPRITIDVAQDWIDRYKAEVLATEAGGGSNDDEHDLLYGIAEDVLNAAGQPMWECSGCGTKTDRYDGGEACTECVLSAFGESG